MREAVLPSGCRLWCAALFRVRGFFLLQLGLWTCAETLAFFKRLGVQNVLLFVLFGEDLLYKKVFVLFPSKVSERLG